MSVIVRNPHSVLAAIKNRPRDVLEVRVPPTPEESWAQVAALAKKQGVRVVSAQSSKGSKGPQGPRSDRSESDGRSSGAEANLKEREPLSWEEILPSNEGAASGGLWLALDQVQDPHNVGAIFRAAGFFGVKGILMTQDRSAALTSAVYDVSCGGVESVPFAVIPNLQRGFEIAKERGLWILGTSEHARTDFKSVEKDRPWLLVLGNEEKGMRRLTEESCDMVCGIQPSGDGVTSLNVSVAAGILISKLA
jgi:23S rRNA (guanosine2251-2'-O)-methyltransferase